MVVFLVAMCLELDIARSLGNPHALAGPFFFFFYEAMAIKKAELCGKHKRESTRSGELFWGHKHEPGEGWLQIAASR